MIRADSRQPPRRENGVEEGDRRASESEKSSSSGQRENGRGRERAEAAAEGLWEKMVGESRIRSKAVQTDITRSGTACGRCWVAVRVPIIAIAAIADSLSLRVALESFQVLPLCGRRGGGERGRRGPRASNAFLSSNPPIREIFRRKKISRRRTSSVGQKRPSMALPPPRRCARQRADWFRHLPPPPVRPSDPHSLFGQFPLRLPPSPRLRPPSDYFPPPPRPLIYLSPPRPSTNVLLLLRLLSCSLLSALFIQSDDARLRIFC
ncbi:hypothetical protein OH77DRAFT_105435 [Trametes cingulata]|nr:hypothetical protein OH77DRAFT_105435 [Trametes cingulata]